MSSYNKFIIIGQALTQVNSTKKVILTSLFGNFFLAIVKLIAFYFSRGPSILAESIHSIGDTFNQLLIYYGFKKGLIGACGKYPVGQGRAQYLFNFLAALGICMGALYTIYHSIYIFIYDRNITPTLSYLAIIVLSISIVVDIYVLSSAYKEVLKNKADVPLLKFLKNTDDPSIVSILLEDLIASIGATLALIGILVSHYTQSIIPDIMTSLLIGLSLLGMGIYLLKVNYSFIIGHSLPTEKLDKINQFLSHHPLIKEIHYLQSEVLAPSKVRLSFEAEFRKSSISDKKQLAQLNSNMKNKSLPFVIYHSHHRAIRSLGPLITDLENELIDQFPYLSIIDIEPY